MAAVWGVRGETSPLIVCILILSIAGSWCSVAPTSSALIGDCTELHRDGYICIAAASDIPLFLSVYDTAICAEHPINCFEGGTHFANGTPTSPEWYGTAAACPLDWTNTGTRLSIPNIPLSLICLDTGGRVHPMYREVWIGDGYAWRWVIVIDVYYPQGELGWPWWALLPHENWSIESP